MIASSGLVFDLRARVANAGTGPHTDDSANGPWADLAAGRNGTLEGFTGSSTVGWQGSGTTLDPYCLVGAGEAEGSSYDMVNMGDLAAYDLTSLTIEVWLKTTDTGALRGVLDNIVNSEGYMIDLGAADADQGKPRFITGNGAPSTEMRGSSKVNDGSWHHLVCTYDSATTTGKVYIDNGTPATSSSMEAPTAPAAGALKLFGDGSSTFRMAGAIAQCRLYNRALSSTEVADNYAAGVTGPSNVNTPTAGDTWAWSDGADPALKTFVQKEYSGRVTRDDGSSASLWTDTGTVTKSVVSGELKLAASNASTDHVKRATIDPTTKGDLVLGVGDAAVSFDLHGASASNGPFYATLYQDGTHSYGLVVAASDAGTSATQKNASNLQTVSVGVGNGTTRRCKLYRVGSKIGGKIHTTAFTESTDSANAGPFELRLGAPNNGGGTSDWRIDNLDVCLSNSIVVRGVPTGGSVRLYDSGGSTLASATESGGTATLDCSSLAFPITGYLKVFTDSYTTLASYGRFPATGNASDIRGGDRYGYAVTEYATVGAEFIAQYATTQADSHNGAITNPNSGISYGVSYGPGGSVLAWWGNRDLGGFQTYEIEPPGTIADQHAATAIQVDSAGYFHIVYGDTPRYRKSSAPWSVNAWGSSVYVDGAGTGSFDAGLLIDQADTLYLIGTTPWATGGNSIFCKTKTPGGSWSATQTIATSVFPYTYYLSDVAVGKESSGQKSVWASFFVHDGSSTYRDCIVIRSTDGAAHWKGISGGNFTLPLTCPSGVLSDSNGIAHSGTGAYISRLCVDSDGTHAHLAMWDLPAGYPKYKRGTIGTGWDAFSKSFTAVNTHGAMEQSGSDLVYVAVGPTPNRLIRYSSSDTGASWSSSADTVISGVPSTSPPQWYWVKLTPVVGQQKVLALWQSRYTTYQSGSSSVTGEGVASLFLAPVAVPVTRTASDSWAWSDAPARQVSQSRTSGDTWAWSDSTTGAISRGRSASDTWAWSDTPARQESTSRTSADTWAWSDSASQVLGHSSSTGTRTAADSWAWTDTAAGPRVTPATYPRTAADIWLWQDQVSRPVTPSPPEDPGYRLTFDIGPYL